MKRILSIDGGGIRGIIPALVLAEIENRTGRPISQLFDLIVGTSTGGILALGLSKDNGSAAPQYRARDLVALYQKNGKEIFSRSLWKGFSSVGGMTDEVYSHKGLEAVLRNYFGEEPIGSALTRVVVTSYDIQARQPVFIKSWKPEHHGVLMRQAARATSAAPTYFEPALTSIDGAVRALIDGGVFINSPAVSGYAEARRLFPDEKHFLLVSLGTGELVRPISYEEAKDWGKAGWVAPLLACMFDGVADAADYQMKMLLGDNYFRMQTDLAIASDDMDNVTAGNIENLKTEAKRLLKTHKAALERLITALDT